MKKHFVLDAISCLEPRGALGSMSHMALKKQSAKTQIRRRTKGQRKSGLPLWVDVKMRKAATKNMDAKERPWLHEPHDGKKAVSKNTHRKNGGRENGGGAYPYGSTSKCTKPPNILRRPRGALGSMSHMAVKMQSATQQIRKTEEGKTEDGPTPMGRRQNAQSRPKFYGAKGAPLAP